MQRREIAITGLGLLTPLGEDVETNWRNVKKRKTGIGYYPEGELPARFHYLGKVSRLNPLDTMPSKLLSQVRFLNRGALLGLVAARQALADSKIDITSIPPVRRALYIGTGDHTKVGYDFLHTAIRKATDGRFETVDSRTLNLACLKEVNPFFLLESIHNNLFSLLSACFELKGPNSTLASLSPCGLHAMELASKAIEENAADMALVVGCGSWINDIALYEIDGLGLITRCREGLHAFKPFDRRRDGFITGEGGAALLLESLDSAKARAADMRGIIKGFGNHLEFSAGGGMSVPSEVTRQSMEAALGRSRCPAKNLAFISPHGSATPKGDRSELASIRKVLDEEGADVPLCGMKPYTGHLGAASDIAEIIFGIQAVKAGEVPATLNFERAEREFSGLRISNFQQPCQGRHFLSASYGMGGQSAAVVISAG